MIEIFVDEIDDAHIREFMPVLAERSDDPQSILHGLSFRCNVAASGDPTTVNGGTAAQNTETLNIIASFR